MLRRSRIVALEIALALSGMIELISTRKAIGQSGTRPSGGFGGGGGGGDGAPSGDGEGAWVGEVEAAWQGLRSILWGWRLISCCLVKGDVVQQPSRQELQ